MAASMLVDSARSMDHVVNKLESLAEQQAATLDRLADRLDSIGKGGSGKSGGKAEEAALGGIANKFKNLTSSLSDLAEAGPKLKEGFKALTEGLKSLNVALKFYSKIPEDAVDNLIQFLKKISDQFQSIDTKKIKEGGEGLSVMALGIAQLGLVLFLATPLYVIGAIGSLIIIPMLALYAYTFSKIGEVAENITEGAKSIGWMSLGIVGFSIALFATKELAGGSWKAYAEGALIVIAGLTVFSLAFYFLGQFADPIEQGAKAAAWMGLALISLAFGIASFQLLKIDIKSVLIAGAAVAVTGLAMGLVGMFASEIEEGALALAFGGLALIALALGIGSFKLFKITSEDFLMAGAAVVAVGGAMFLAGLMAIPILLGAAALLVASIAMITLSLGILTLNAVYQKAMTGLLAPSTQYPDESNMEVMIGGIADAFAINPIKSVFMLAGAAALLVASIAMITLSVGLLAINFAFNKAKDGILKQDPNDPEELMMNSVITGIVSAFTINPIKSAFMLLGAAGLIVASVALITLTGGLLAFNFAYKKSAMLFEESTMSAYKGRTNIDAALSSVVDGMVMGPIKLLGFYASVPAWLMAGFALMSIAGGLAGFANIIQRGIPGGIEGVSKSVNSVLTSVLNAFVDVSRGKGTAVDWDDVEDGIDAVSGVGNIIKGMAEGVAKMADLKFPIYDKNGKITGYFGIGDKQFQQVTTNMKMLITAIAGTLTEVGKSQGETGWFSKSDGEKGAEVIRGIGGDLVGLADFVQKAANLTFPIYDKNGKQTGVTVIDPSMLAEGGSVRTNIINMIKAVTGALADVGSGEAANSGWFRDSDIEKGKAAIQGISADLNGIAAMVTSVAAVKDFSQVANRIKLTLMVIPQAFLDAAKIIEPNKEKLEAVTNIFGTLVDPLKNFIDLLAKVEEKKITEKTGSGLSSSLSKIMATIAGIKPNMDMTSLDKAVGYLERMAATADPLTKLADSFERIAKSMDKFAGTFKKMDGKTVKTSDLLIQSLVTFAKVDPNAFSTLTDKGAALINFIYEKGNAKPATPVTEPTPTTAINSEPGKTAVKPAEVATQTKPGAQQNNAQLTQMMTDLTTNMASMAGALKDIKMILQGTLKVQTVA